jgi:hypothetical protein
MDNDPRLKLQILICLSLFCKIGNSAMFDIGFHDRNTRLPIRSLDHARPGFIREGFVKKYGVKSRLLTLGNSLTIY